MAIIAAAIFLRIWHLGNFPGCNGDEAWIGYKALRLLSGESYEWKTKTGNLPNPFYFYPLVGLHALFPPSFTLLRVLAVVCGVLALPLNFVLCRRVFGAKTAWLSTVLLAALPANIAYSRFGWEPSQSVLVSLCPLYFSLLALREETFSKRWLLAALISIPVAIIVHPMNVFLAPFPLVTLALRWPALTRDVLLLRKSWRSALGWTIIAIVLAGGVKWKWAFLQQRFAQASWSTEPGSFAWGIVRLFSGNSVYAYIPGVKDGSSVLAQNLAVAVLLTLAVGVAFWRTRARLSQENHKLDFSVAISWLSGAVLFFVMIGAAGLSPENSRYGLFLVAPGALLISRLFGFTQKAKPRYSKVVNGAFMVLCLLLLFGFWRQYILVFQNSGGEADPTFQTAAIEPKQVALEMILSKQNRARPFIIASTDWWAYWPIRYLSMKEKNLTMLQGDEMNTPQGTKLLQRSMSTGDAWFVEFASMSTGKNLKLALERAGMTCQEFHIERMDGTPAITILHPLPAS